MIAHYCIIRADLPPGVQKAQLIHAAGESTLGQRLSSGTYAFALSAKDEQELLEISERLFFAGVQHKQIREPDAPYNGALMAIGVCPGPRKVLRKHFSNLPLSK